MKPAAIVSLVLAVVAVAFAALFWVQNSSRTTDLSLNFGVTSTHLTQPVSVPLLMAICFGTGLAIGIAVFAVRSVRLARKVRRLEQSLALSGEGSEWR